MQLLIFEVFAVANPFGMLNDVLTIWLLRNQVFLISHPVSPSLQSWSQLGVITHIPLRVVGSNGLGPSTSRLSGVCSNQLSYEPIMVEVIGFEPMTSCLQGRRSTS